MSTYRSLLAAACVATLLPACGADEISADAVPVRVLSYNIGNPNDTDPDYPLRLKEQAYEDFMAQQIRDLGADIVLLQEVLSPTLCAEFNETDPALTCFESANRGAAAQRILGPDYTVVCDAREHVECIGVHVAFGEIAGRAPGSFTLDGAETPPLPLDSCIYADGACNNDLCDAESTVSAVTVTTDFGELRVVHAHPNAPGQNTDGSYTGEVCRRLQLEQIFEGVTGAGDTALVANPVSAPSTATIVGGDFNMDPLRFSSDTEKELWFRHVGDGKRFSDFTPLDENGEAHATRRMNFGVAIDHVIADRADTTGSECIVHGDDFIATDPGTLPLDQDFDWTQVPDGEFYLGRIDHFAISCDLILDLSSDITAD